MTKRCRVCKKEVGTLGWPNHINKHKKDFAKIIGRFEGEAHNINFEDVVMYFNPQEANERKCIGYPLPDKVNLNDFGQKPTPSKEIK